MRTLSGSMRVSLPYGIRSWRGSGARNQFRRVNPEFIVKQTSIPILRIVLAIVVIVWVVCGTVAIGVYQIVKALKELPAAPYTKYYDSENPLLSGWIYQYQKEALDHRVETYVVDSGLEFTEIADLKIAARMQPLFLLLAQFEVPGDRIDKLAAGKTRITIDGRDLAGLLGKRGGAYPVDGGLEGPLLDRFHLTLDAFLTEQPYAQLKWWPPEGEAWDHLEVWEGARTWPAPHAPKHGQYYILADRASGRVWLLGH